MSTVDTKSSSSGGARVAVQRFGRFLSGMVMPNMGAFIAWGLITALFIPTGWFPNEGFAQLVDPMKNYLLPLLIGYTGGTMIHGQRGGVIGAIMTMGVIVGADIPMFLGAMVAGPLAAWILKKFDKAIEGKVKSGFEMLVNNFSAGIIGAILALLAHVGIGPVVQTISQVLSAGVQFLVNAGLLPLVNLIIEPGKVLFLNNALNHGVLSPIALEEASRTGKSVLFMLESNPGPGLGILLAYCLFGKGSAKSSAPGAVIIHFFGGIHEIYFPYILMKPILILAAIAGGVVGTFCFMLTGAGLVAAPSPGSIIAYFLMTPKGGYLPMLSGVVAAAVVSFAVAAVLLKTGKQKEEGLEEAASRLKDMKNQSKGASASATVAESNQASGRTAEGATDRLLKDKSEVNKIVFSCDAGMGSSAMGASILRKKMKQAGVDVTVTNTAISEIPQDADIVITQKTLTDRAKTIAPNAEHISIDNFLKSPEYEALVDRLKSGS
ncbi:PTS mannitol transporter subunit IICBA [Paenibacillus sp. CMAA1739]|uniref:PTS mannitol transporter subunit IICB n=1 Tax=Paenibacillus ottowii TaxID=2315729 RepID=UPI0027309FD5|nr:MULTISPECIES: PTS mannitol transporter subunit IICBA [Paenibacillus]MDP1512502.1 PTS mannitol transporter subunit IICBA [Paenibacillus ottowii]MEC4564404.1 PTS mannitol transporter subunit IICBA [Paenibacillus sp. CMAA1739]